jgi:hypothetical protein
VERVSKHRQLHSKRCHVDQVLLHECCAEVTRMLAVNENTRSERVTFDSQCVTLEASSPLGHVLLRDFHHLILGR